MTLTLWHPLQQLVSGMEWRGRLGSLPARLKIGYYPCRQT